VVKVPSSTSNSLVRSTLTIALKAAVKQGLTNVRAFVEGEHYAFGDMIYTGAGGNKYYKLVVLYKDDIDSLFGSAIITGPAQVAAFTATAQLRCSTKYARAESTNTVLLPPTIEQNTPGFAANCVAAKRLFL
jgi:hypothetical protein